MVGNTAMNDLTERPIYSNFARMKLEGVWKMNKASLRIVAILALVNLAACQRPTQRLPAAPQFEQVTSRSSDATTISAAPEASSDDALSLPDGIVPGSVEDFIRFAGTDKVYFEYDKSDLLAEGKLVLNKQAEWLSRYPNVRVSLEGHADERGTREYNFALGERRAAAMRTHLLGQGLMDERISTTSFGKERPLASGSDEASWGINRRGETFLVGAVGQ